MKIIIVGAGLIGVTTAWFARARGHEVTVIDQTAGPGLETSFANGGLLTPSMSDPWNSPGSWRAILASLGRSDAALQLRLGALPDLATWGIAFLQNSERSKFQRNTLSNLRLGLHSLKTMRELRGRTWIAYGQSARGTLRIFREQQSLDRMCSAADELKSNGLHYRRLSVDNTVDLEPALRPIAHFLTGAIHYEHDEAGDAYRFCAGLSKGCEEQGVRFFFGVKASAFVVRDGTIAVTTDGESFVGDRVVVAAASHSASLLRSVGIRLPVKPVKGYSLTLTQQPGEHHLSIPVVDDTFHAAITPMEGAIRVAGTAEFAGYDGTIRPARIQNLRRLLSEVLPHASFGHDTAQPWCGFRPVSPDGVPFIGQSQVPNLFINTGHGHLGWTLAAGSAQLISTLIDNETPPIDAAPYSPRRFDRYGGAVAA